MLVPSRFHPCVSLIPFHTATVALVPVAAGEQIDMITISRRQVRHLRAVFRRSVLGIGHRGSIPPLVLRAEGTQLRAQYRYSALAVEHVELGSYQPGETIALPLDALADVEGKDDSPIVLEAAAPDKTIVRWEDHGIPQTREYAVPALDVLAAFPEPPRSWQEAPADLLDALAEATATGAEDRTRYALDCIALKGASGEIVATDGHQLLVQGGFRFPWDGDVLIKRSPVFACKELPRDRSLAIARTDEWVVLRAGRWTVLGEIQTDMRFPRVDQVVPDTTATATWLRLDGADAAFLAQALDRLPGADELNSPATVDLNGRVAVRTQGADHTPATELVLARSRSTGAAVRFNTNREFLARAIRLGFTEIEISDAEAPVVCRDGRRTFAWQPLSPESALEPTDDVTRVTSDSPVIPTAIRPDAPPKARTLVSERTTPAGPGATTNGASNGHATPEGIAATGLAALIQEAEALHDALADAKSRASRLTVALRRYRRRERLVSTTLASLKALKLQDVAG
jgi:hypothetical protein